MMVAQSPLVGANGVVVLNSVAHIGLYVSFVIDPCHAKFHQPVGDAQPFDEIGFLKFRVLVILIFNRTQYLTHCLNVLRLIGESLLQILYNIHCSHKFYNFVIFHRPANAVVAHKSAASCQSLVAKL